MVDDRWPLVGIEYGCILTAGRLFGPTDDYHDVTLMLDTAASLTMIRGAALAQVGIDLSRPKERRRVEAMGGTVVEGIVTVPRLRILGQEQAALEVIFTRRPFPYRVDGVLGLNFLLPYRLCMDFPNGWIELISP
jgi:hypothetical protein